MWRHRSRRALQDRGWGVDPGMRSRGAEAGRMRGKGGVGVLDAALACFVWGGRAEWRVDGFGGTEVGSVRL